VGTWLSGRAPEWLVQSHPPIQPPAPLKKKKKKKRQDFGIIREFKIKEDLFPALEFPLDPDHHMG
jgi:hypothetical protein